MIHNPETYVDLLPWYKDIEYDEIKFNHLYQQNMLIISRCWERTMHHFTQFLEKSPFKLFGDIDYLFFRKEFQTELRSLGNKPHGHAGGNILNESKAQFADRICCDPNSFLVKNIELHTSNY